MFIHPLQWSYAFFFSVQYLSLAGSHVVTCISLQNLPISWISKSHWWHLLTLKTILWLPDYLTCTTTSLHIAMALFVNLNRNGRILPCQNPIVFTVKWHNLKGVPHFHTHQVPTTPSSIWKVYPQTITNIWCSMVFPCFSLPCPFILPSKPCSNKKQPCPAPLQKGRKVKSH